MKKVTEAIPNLDALKAELKAVMESGLTDFLKTTNARRAEVRGSILFCAVALLFLLTSAVFMYVMQVDVHTVIGKITTMIILLWATVLLISGRGWFVSSTLLAREVNMALVPILADTFNRTMLYTYNEKAAEMVARSLNQSKLFTAAPGTLAVKNVYSVFGEHNMQVYELVLDQPAAETQPVGKRCHATLIEIDTIEESSGETVVVTVGNRYGFSQDGFLQAVAADTALEPYTLQSMGDSDVRVLTTHPEWADSLLTPGFLDRVAQWGQAADVSLRLMRTANKLYILIPTSKESTTYSSTSTKRTAIEHYALKIARPVWRALTLAEEVR